MPERMFGNCERVEREEMGQPLLHTPCDTPFTQLKHSKRKGRGGRRGRRRGRGRGRRETRMLLLLVGAKVEERDQPGQHVRETRFVRSLLRYADAFQRTLRRSREEREEKREEKRRKEMRGQRGEAGRKKMRKKERGRKEEKRCKKRN